MIGYLILALDQKVPENMPVGLHADVENQELTIIVEGIETKVIGYLWPTPGMKVEELGDALIASMAAQAMGEAA